MKNRLFIIASLILILLFSFDCRKNDRTIPTVESKITVLYMGDERVLTPYGGMEAQLLVFLPIVSIKGDGSGDVQPALAENWEHSDDYRTWIFYLNKNIRWHDGVPVTAHDIKFTIDLWKDTNFPSYSGQSAEVVDDHTVRISFPVPSDALDAWNVYLPKHLLENLDPKKIWTYEFWTKPIGNGPYRYVRHMPKIMVELEANPDYYKETPKINRFVLKFSWTPSIPELLSGNVDALSYVSRLDLLKLPDDSHFLSYYWWGNWIETIYWNHRNPLFSDPTIRRALTLAINRNELAEVLYYPDGVPIFDTICTDRQFKRGELPEPLPYDPSLAKNLLEEAGWHDSDGDGIREKAKKEFHFTAIVQTGQPLEKGAIYIQEQFRQVGIRMEIQSLEYGLLTKRLLSGEFEVVLWRFMNQLSRPAGHLVVLGANSPIGYSNSKMTQLLQAAKDAINPDQKDRIYREIMPIFLRDLPLTLLFPQVQTHVVHRRFQGLSNMARPDPVWFAEYLWIDGN
ncbi:MAG: peptide ABC transporter substrate-binding protein [Candidatus Aminicenantaceae bacterium]